MSLLDDVKSKVNKDGADALKEAIKQSGVELSDEQLDAIAGGLQNCETDEELKNLVRQSGYELSDEQLNGDKNGICYTNCPQLCEEY